MGADAGMDLLLASARDIKQGVEVKKALEHAITSGKLDRDEFEAATRRIVKVCEELSGAVEDHVENIRCLLFGGIVGTTRDLSLLKRGYSLRY